MRRLVAWLAGGIGGIALLRAWLRRQEQPAVEAPAPPPAEPEPAPDPRAEELRRKLEESRELVGERDEFEAGEMPVDLAEAPGEPNARRREVHDRGRAAIDRMRRRDERG